MTNYAGFWIRVAAYLIDFVLLIVASLVIGYVFGVDFFDESAALEYTAADFVTLIIGIIYFVAFESSSMQGTVGKRAVGLIVTDAEGNRITWLRALGRYFAKILSGLFFLIGYIMVAFTERKQGLHDMICGTLVLKGRPGDGAVDPTVFD